jgi:adenylate cyclase
MTIRLKILSVAVALLAVFGIVVGVSAILQRQVTAEIGGITRYHEPLTALISDFDVITFEYELVPLRLLRRSGVTETELASERTRAQELAQRITDDFHKADALIDQAVDDPALPVHSRIVFARLDGAVAFLQRKIDPFIKAGETVMNAEADGRLADAQAGSLAFRDYEEAFGPDTAAIRHDIAALTASSIETVYVKQKAIEYLGFALFVFAACLGLGVGVIVSTGVVRTLRRLIEGTRALEAGEFAVPVPIHTNDEIGELAIAFNRMVEELRAKDRIKDTFGKYVDPRIVAGLIDGKGDDADHADRRVVTVFFSDIRGFTSISEQLTAAAMVNFLNHYFAAVTRCIRASNGIVDKYIGDAVMAFWAPPFSEGDSHAVAACLAALDQQAAIDEVRREMPNILGLRRNAPNLVVRMGIATGEAVVGTIGSPTSKSFTVIGDTVNLASRLEGINKEYDTRLIVADDTLRLAQNAVEAREIDLITVAGKSEPVRIHELICRAGEIAPVDAELRDEFAKGLEAYRARAWDEAERVFRHCLTIKSGDGPSAVYITRVEELRRNPPPPDWDGVWRFTHK